LRIADRISPEAILKERLKTKLASNVLGHDTPRLSFLRPVPIMAAISLFILASVAAKYVFFAPSRALALSEYLTRSLQTSQPRQLISGGYHQNIPVSPLVRIPSDSPSPYGHLFKALLPSAAQEYPQLHQPQPEWGPPNMSLDETIRLLFYDKSMEKFILEYAKKNKEA
jgi:hypothetical protein